LKYLTNYCTSLFVEITVSLSAMHAFIMSNIHSSKRERERDKEIILVIVILIFIYV